MLQAPPALRSSGRDQPPIATNRSARDFAKENQSALPGRFAAAGSAERCHVERMTFPASRFLISGRPSARALLIPDLHRGLFSIPPAAERQRALPRKPGY